MARTPDPLLHYAAPVLRRPGVLLAAEWLNYFAALTCVAYLAVGGLLFRIGLAARAGRSSVRLLGVLMWGTPDQVFLGATTIGYGIAFGAAALFIALSIRALRRRRLTRA